MKLLIFTRYPREGQVKTRLIPFLGKKGSSLLHKEMTDHTLRQLGSYPNVQIWYEGEKEKAMKKWLGTTYSYLKQCDGDLGEKIFFAFKNTFLEGENKVVLVGSDCPGITLSHIEEANLLLEKVDVVLGPAKDGGYYLIGMCAPHAELFYDIPWGTEEVFKRTVERTIELGLTSAFLEVLADVDRPEDIAVWNRYR